MEFFYAPIANPELLENFSCGNDFDLQDNE